MASTAVTTTDNATMMVTYTSSGANWNIDNDTNFDASGLNVRSILFVPSAANDILRIREKDATGADLVYFKPTDTTDQRIKYFGGANGKRIFPFIVLSEQTFGTPANVKIIFELA